MEDYRDLVARKEQLEKNIKIVRKNTAIVEKNKSVHPGIIDENKYLIFEWEVELIKLKWRMETR